MKLPSSSAFACFISVVCVFQTLDACVCGVPVSKQFIVPAYNKDDDCRLEDLVPLKGPALHTLLKGLAALLVQLYPEICPKCVPKCKKEKEEPIKIFRQIMQIPSPVFPAPCLPPMYKPAGQQQQQPQQCGCSEQFYPVTCSPPPPAPPVQNQRYFPTAQYCQPPINQQNQILSDPCCCY